MPPKPTLETLDNRMTNLEHKVDDILLFVGPDSFLRKHGKRAFAAVMGAAIYAGLIDGKIGMFFGRLIGIA